MPKSVKDEIKRERLLSHEATIAGSMAIYHKTIRETEEEDVIARAAKQKASYLNMN